MDFFAVFYFKGRYHSTWEWTTHYLVLHQKQWHRITYYSHVIYFTHNKNFLMDC